MRVMVTEDQVRVHQQLHGSDGEITEFNEKPQVEAGRISGGYFVANRKLFDYIDDKEDLVFEEEPIKRLVQDKQMMMYRHNGFWQPMDTWREYKLLNALYEKGEASWVR